MFDFVDAFIFSTYIVCHVAQITHEAAWVCAVAAGLFLQHIGKLGPAYASLLGKIISATQKTVVLPNMYVYPIDAVYVAIACHTLFHTLQKPDSNFRRQLSHRKMMLCFFIVLSYVAHGRHSSILKQPLYVSAVRVFCFILAFKLSKSTEWDTLGKTLWILNVPFPVLILFSVQAKLEIDEEKQTRREQFIVTEKGPMLV